MSLVDGSDTFETIPRSAFDPASAPSATYELVVIAGPDQGLRVTIDGKEPSAVLVGASPACDVRLSDRETSRRHLGLDLIDRRLHLVDLGSTNGTSVNGIATVEAYLTGGELVQIGGTTLRVELKTPATIVPMSQAREFGRVIGASLGMRRLYPLCERLAASSIPVVIEGETGTGKELLAESLHEQGPRADGPFVVFDCTASPPNLVESDLFGHVRGAFTGAVAPRVGVFESAHGGTLLIDEIGDLDLALQPRLLRALERSEIRRVGGDRPIHVDVRVLCATRRDLDREVAAGRFRDDLFHRLAVGRVELPPLRRRRGDVPLLTRVFCTQNGSEEAPIPDSVLASWEAYEWPGNVRELRNAVMRYLALGELAVHYPAAPYEQGRHDGDQGAGDGVLERVVAASLPYSRARQQVLEAFERAYVERVLAEHDGNVMRAAAASGIARRHFQRVKARVQR